MSEVTQYPVFKARHVMGSFTQLNTKDHNGAPVDESKHHWFMAFAVPKGAEWEALWATMHGNASNDPSCTAALCNQAGFNWKTDDCDAPADPQNKGKASYPAGHMLIKFTRNIKMGPVPIVDGNYTPIDPLHSGLKRGDYYHVSASTMFNTAKTVNTNAGMYQNINGLMFAAQGEEIKGEGGFNAQTAFAGLHGGQVPGGTQPPAQQPPAQQPPAQQPPAQQPPAQQPPAQQPPAASTPPPPATDLVQPGNVTPPPPVPVEEMYEYGGKTQSLKAWNAEPGWGGDLIKTHGKKV